MRKPLDQRGMQYVPHECYECGSCIIKKDHVNMSEYRTRKFCSPHCAGIYTTRPGNFRPPKCHKVHPEYTPPLYNKCVVCEKPVKCGMAECCGRSCAAVLKYTKYIENWKIGVVDGLVGEQYTSRSIRRYMIETYGDKCFRCGWNTIHPVTGRVPIQLHHIDGNYKNNSESNFELLCPNCHSLTENYGHLNIGNGRKSRQLEND